MEHLQMVQSRHLCLSHMSSKQSKHGIGGQANRMSDRYGYIAIETLLNFCENSKDHAVTPNDFMRMARVRVPERKTGRWIYGENDGQDGWYCSECKGFIPWDYDFYGLNNIDFIKDFKTCPFCDSKMISCTGSENMER